MPDPVGATMSACSPAAIRGHPSACGGVGPSKARPNQSRTSGWNAASGFRARAIRPLLDIRGRITSRRDPQRLFCPVNARAMTAGRSSKKFASGGVPPKASPAVSVNVFGLAARSALKYDDSAAAPPTATLLTSMGAMGFSADGLANHNWDRGNAHLQRMINLAPFPYLSANLAGLRGNLTGVRPYKVFRFGRVDVGAWSASPTPRHPLLRGPGALARSRSPTPFRP